MDLLHTLLSFFTSLTTAALIAFYTIVGGLFASQQKITILPPVPQEITRPTQATTSSESIINIKSPAPKPKPAQPSAPVATLISSTTVVASTTLPPPSPAISAEKLNTQTRGALVNILCAVGSGSLRPISGSGVFVDTRGVILTNAHIGQYFLLKDYPSKDNVECTIRTGSPASPRYTATLLFLPPLWVSGNSTQLIAEQGKGTGENDYAFLLVTSAIGSEPLPAAFPALPMASAEPDLGAAMFLAAYPAGFLGGSSIQKNLFTSSAYATIKELFTFSDDRTIDLVSVGGTVVSQGGSSGGAMVRAYDGKLQGIIATATAADSTAQRDLRAITLAHINRSLAAQGQGSLSAFLSQDMLAAAAHFASSTALVEKELLVKAIEHR